MDEPQEVGRGKQQIRGVAEESVVRARRSSSSVVGHESWSTVAAMDERAHTRAARRVEVGVSVHRLV
jgi:hypothetical protein